MSTSSFEIERLEIFPEKLYTRPGLKNIFLAHSGIPDWLLKRCQQEGGDLAETLARCWPEEGPGLEMSAADFVETLYSELSEPTALLAVWNRCSTPERIEVNRLLLGQRPPPPEVIPDPNLPRKEIRAELMYALLSGKPEYSFGLRKGTELVVCTRMQVEDPALEEPLLKYIDEQTVEKKGPVRVVAPGQVARISYTGLSISPRHKSGFKVENPRLEEIYPAGGLWMADAFSDL